MSTHLVMQCDRWGCGNHVVITSHLPPETQMPESWYLVRPADRGVETLHFCGADCLATWAQEVKRPAAPVPVPLPSNA